MKFKNQKVHKVSLLKDIIKKYKVEVLKQNFISKIRLNSVNRPPLDTEESLFENENQSGFGLFNKCLN